MTFSAPVEITVTPLQNATFAESGLPEVNTMGGQPIGGVTWYVTVGGQEYVANAGDPINVPLAGPTAFTVGYVSVMDDGMLVRYSPSPSSGTAEPGQTVNVRFST